MVLQFLRERIRQPSKPPHVHPHREVLALHVAGRNMLLIRVPDGEYKTDPQGREVRANIPAVEEVMTADGPKRRSKFYALFRSPATGRSTVRATGAKDFVENAVQLTLDVDSYNENNIFGETIPPIDWNIGKDVTEKNMPTEYDPDPYGDEDNDD